jgi:glycine reductase
MSKAIHYINQFFGQIGGEEEADYPPSIEEGTVGPANLLDQLLDAEVTHTVICGDNYMNSNEKDAVETVLEALEDKEFDIFIAGPAFQAGRYGTACGIIGKAVKEKFDVPVITCMNEENPGVDIYQKDLYIFPGGKSAAKMRDDMGKVADFANKILAGEKLKPAKEEGYFPRGRRHQVWREDEKPAAERAVEMLTKKLAGEDFETELPMPEQVGVEIADPIEDLSKAEVALVTSGGIVPVGNPDNIQSASATRWGKYDISDLDKLPNREVDGFRTIHAGYDPAAADEDPDRVLPLDSMRKYEEEGRIGKLHEYFYATVGTGTTEAEAARMGEEIAAELVEAGVQAVVLTST